MKVGDLAGLAFLKISDLYMLISKVLLLKPFNLPLGRDTEGF